MKTVLALAVLLLTGSAWADEPQLPYFRDGLWQATTSRALDGKTSHMSMKLCQSRETQDKDREMSASLRKRSQCTYKISHPSADTYVSQDQCPAGKPTSRSTVSFQNDKGYRMEMHRGSGSQESVMIIEAKYLGACPADMKPGDIVMADGTKMNVEGK